MNTYTTGYFSDLAQKIAKGYEPDLSEYESVINIADKDVFSLIPGANHIREFFFGNKTSLCTIRNSKSGKCPENCSFCAQSAWWQIPDTPAYPIIPPDEALKGADAAGKSPVNRYSLVNSGRGPTAEDTEILSSYLASFPKETGTAYCASLGLMNESGLRKLKNAGLSRYHHNLESARSLFGKICTTHTYDERINTIISAKSAGLEVCSGGIFGMGETDAQILELAIDLKRLNVDAVPVNFLVPIKGTPLEKMKIIRPSRCLKIIAFLRYVLPDKEIIVCAGRDSVIGSFQDMCVWAGASGLMTGNYLTVSGPLLSRDLEMLRRTGFQTKEKSIIKGKGD